MVMGLLCNASADPCCIAKTDVKAAFQPLSREQAVRIFEHHSNSPVVNFSPYLRFQYDTPSKLLVRVGNDVVDVIMSSEGVIQGRSSSGSVFPLCTHVIIVGLMQYIKQQHLSVMIFELQDDVFFVGQVSHVGLTVVFFNSLMKLFLNLESETSKLALLYGPSSCITIPAAVISLVNSVGTMNLFTGTMPALGGIISYPEPHHQIAGLDALPIDLPHNR